MYVYLVKSTDHTGYFKIGRSVSYCLLLPQLGSIDRNLIVLVGTWLEVDTPVDVFLFTHGAQ